MFNNPENCFACGTKNPYGLQLTFDYKDERIVCEFTLPERFQGYPGIAHGGIVSTILDETMAHLLMNQNIYAVTGKLEVSFHRPVPINKALFAEGYFPSGRQSRWGKILQACIIDEDRNVLAKAKALFIDRTEEMLAGS